jgi:hypothetical protein
MIEANETIIELKGYTEFLESLIEEKEEEEMSTNNLCCDIINEVVEEEIFVQEEPCTKKQKRNDNRFIENVELQFKVNINLFKVNTII